MRACVPVCLNTAEAWALVTEAEGGVNLRLSIDEWEAARLCPGQRVLTRLPGRPDAWLFVADVTEQPPFVWVGLAPRLLAPA